MFAKSNPSLYTVLNRMLTARRDCAQQKMGQVGMFGKYQRSHNFRLSVARITLSDTINTSASYSISFQFKLDGSQIFGNVVEDVVDLAVGQSCSKFIANTFICKQYLQMM